MSEFPNIENELDQSLQQMLRAYAVTPERDPESARHNQERFVAILNMIFEGPVRPKSFVEWLSPSAWPSAFRYLKRRIAASTRLRTILLASAVLLVILLFLFGGMGITAYAASASLPGDALYSFKTTIETARAGLTVNSDSQARLYLRFAARRLSEIQALIRAGRYDDIPRATSEFENDIQRSLNAIETLSQTDHARAVGLSAETTAILRSYEDILVPSLAVVPNEAQAAIQKAIDAARSAAITLDTRYDDFNHDGGIDEEENSITPSPLASEFPKLTDTPQPSLEASEVLEATGTPTPLPIVVEVLPTTTPPIPTATQSAPIPPPALGSDGSCQGPIGAAGQELHPEWHNRDRDIEDRAWRFTDGSGHYGNWQCPG